MSDKNKITLDDEQYISIRKSEYDHLVRCKHEYMVLLEQMQAIYRCEINNAIQQRAFQILNQTNVTCQHILK